MSDSTAKQDDLIQAETEVTQKAQPDSVEMSGEAELESTLEQAEAEAQKLKDQLLRAMAEAENTRRRMQKEVQEAQKYGVSSFAKEMLTIADNFTRALEAVPAAGNDDPALKNLVEGIEAIGRQLQSAFERFGIQKIDPMGELFDPHTHRVMMEQEDLSKPAGTIVQVFQPGYRIHDRLLREAMVVVSKGGAPAHKVDTSA